MIAIAVAAVVLVTDIVTELANALSLVVEAETRPIRGDREVDVQEIDGVVLCRPVRMGRPGWVDQNHTWTHFDRVSMLLGADASQSLVDQFPARMVMHGDVHVAVIAACEEQTRFSWIDALWISVQ